MKDEVLSLHLERPFCASLEKKSLRCPGMSAPARVDEEREITGRRLGQGICENQRFPLDLQL